MGDRIANEFLLHGGIMNISMIIFGASVAALLFVSVLIVLSPLPTVKIMRKFFEKPDISRPEKYEKIKESTRIYKDLTYPSKYSDNTLDIYVPEKHLDKFPVILWIHGGAYVGGDKGDVRYYARKLAAEGYAVVSMNYERAPEARFPAPLTQMGEVYLWLLSVSRHYFLDMSAIILAGDSAGAHTSALFTLIQTDDEYSKKIGLNAQIPKEHIKGLMLFCGPYDNRKTAALKGIMGFLIRRAGWAYFGTRNWAVVFDDLTTVRYHIKKSMPPVFITDADTLSFKSQAKDLISVLKAADVHVRSFFIDDENQQTKHEYQFKMDTQPAKKCFELMLLFLDELFI